MTPAELSREVRAAFAYAARYLSVLAESDPHRSAADLLTRPDVDAVLQQALDHGREIAQDAVREQWGGGPRHEYLDWLLTDIDRSYDSLAVLRAGVRASWHSATKAGRAKAVRDAIMSHGIAVSLRNQLAAESAAVASVTQRKIADGEELQDAGEQVFKQWRCSHSPPDPDTCHWCRILHGMVIPLHGNFPMGEDTDLTGHGHLTRPPRLYHGVLQGPPRHPRCRCRIVIVTHLADTQVESEPGGQGVAGQQEADHPSHDRARAIPGFLSAADIRSLPEDRYQALIHFLDAAVHELKQVLAKLRQAVRRSDRI